MQGKGGKGFETCLSAAVCFQIGNAIGLDFSKSSVSEIEKRLYVGAVSDINKASLGILVDALIILSKQASNGKNNSDMGQADFNQRVQDIISYARMESIRNEQQTAQGWIEDSKKKRRNSEFFS
jgi:hypothetical protein